MSSEQARAYRLADNQTATLAEWDDAGLAVELADLRDTGFDLALTGFAQTDLDDLLAPPPSDPLTDPDDVPEPPTEPVTRSATCGCWAGTAWSAGTRPTRP